MSDNTLSDAISAASLVLAVMAALYTLWLPSVTEALKIVPEQDSANRGPQKSQVVSAILTKALPLSAASAAAGLILFARFVSIVAEAWDHRAGWRYDDVKALMALTYVLIVLLAGVAAVQLVGLVFKRLELNKGNAETRAGSAPR
jgi:uncharacterized membrane protein YcjF (UPF0283 family)